MAKVETIKSYLVSLGFSVTEGELRKFKDTLKQVTKDVEHVTGTITKGFVGAGLAIGGALAGIGVGVLDLMNNTAAADLGFQVFARRMYMNTDAAKQMKIATDALGYSLEDIVWGPKELRDRYGVLIEDQRRMNKGLGGNFEDQMKKIRDVRFEFTRMGVELEYFGMKLTTSVMDKLFGGPDSMDKRLDQLNRWFQENIPRLADELATKIVPMLEKLGQLAGKIFTTKNIDWVINIVTKGADNLTKTYDFVTGNTGKGDPTSALGGLWDKSKSFNQNMNALVGGVWSGTDGGTRDQVIGDLLKAGRGSGDYALLLALAGQETGEKFNVDAQNGRTGAFGLGQVMPKNWPKGMNPGSEQDQISVMQSIIMGNLKRRKGNLRDALHDYYGWGQTPPGEPTFDQYYDQFQEKYQRYKKEFGTTYNPSAYSGKGVDIGGITVNVAHTNATADDIASAVVHRVREEAGRRTQDNLAQFSGVYA